MIQLGEESYRRVRLIEALGYFHSQKISDFLRREDLGAVRRAIHSLPVLYRDVLILRFLEEKSYEEIVDIIKKPKGTVATLIRRGRALLLAELEHPH